jgi:hypothetical protein
VRRKCVMECQAQGKLGELDGSNVQRTKQHDQAQGRGRHVVLGHDHVTIWTEQQGGVRAARVL